ncbi:hypothetical protein M427DRAFT_51934 [Gonapodya prolifera JEL478]|uniref:Zn(2)-C6 fungal-type domain-containing protein n=1 Tax=Gonapodya prolifera (strain JEL478) TaxID=1344416 RepID=A0A139AW69_GONPJ|nr:hypothetical protein M427DRAFT_51934 [Gonapodya prolifera JEL478]|eukprot:KXS20982.1 hypothetical protein M427DRAFT_51934 [Gonapodya prolifera JEL478]
MLQPDADVNQLKPSDSPGEASFTSPGPEQSFAQPPRKLTEKIPACSNCRELSIPCDRTGMNIPPLPCDRCTEKSLFCVDIARLDQPAIVGISSSRTLLSTTPRPHDEQFPLADHSHETTTSRSAEAPIPASIPHQYFASEMRNMVSRTSPVAERQESSAASEEAGTPRSRGAITTPLDLPVISSQQLNLDPPAPEALATLLPVYFVHVAPHAPFIHPETFLADAIERREKIAFLLFTMLTLAAPFHHAQGSIMEATSDRRNLDVYYDRTFCHERSSALSKTILETTVPVIEHVWGLIHLALAYMTAPEPNTIAANIHLGSALSLAKVLRLDVETVLPQQSQTLEWIVAEQNRRTYLALWWLDRLIAGISDRSPILEISPMSTLRSATPDRTWIQVAFENKPQRYPGMEDTYQLLDATMMFAAQEQRIETLRNTISGIAGETDETCRWKISECQKLQRHRESNPHLFLDPASIQTSFSSPMGSVDHLYYHAGRSLSIQIHFHNILQRMLPKTDLEQRFRNAFEAMSLVLRCMDAAKRFQEDWVDMGCPLTGFAVFSLACEMLWNPGTDRQSSLDLVYSSVEALDGFGKRWPYAAKLAVALHRHLSASLSTHQIHQ